MTTSVYSGPIFFVGGAPRSGTTVTHALICSAARMNAYHPEISYVTPIVRGYSTGLEMWDAHTKSFFAERSHFKHHMTSILGQIFHHIYRALREPEMLCVKDPLLTPYFPKLAELLDARAHFVTVVRHPYDVVRSRQEVAEKRGDVFNASKARMVATQYMQSYEHLDAPIFNGRLMHFRYEDMLSQVTLGKIREFTGCPDISTENVWGQNTGPRKPGVEDKQAEKDPWYSPKYHGSIDLSSRLSPLEGVYCEVVDTICAPMMKRFGYQGAATVALA